MRILVVEDEYSLLDIIATKLKEEKYIVDTALNGREGLDLALSNIYDLVILDIMLPFVNGIDILKEMKDNKINSKVIMLTAKSTLEDKLIGFNNGANDYITKPFHIEELIARVNAQLRASNNLSLEVITYGDLELNLNTSMIRCINNNEEILLSYKEFIILEYLMDNKKQIISKEQLYNKVWGLDNDFESNNLEVYLSFIRKKIKAIGSKVNIKSIRKIGYRLDKV